MEIIINRAAKTVAGLPGVRKGLKRLYVNKEDNYEDDTYTIILDAENGYTITSMKVLNVHLTNVRLLDREGNSYAQITLRTDEYDTLEIQG